MAFIRSRLGYKNLLQFSRRAIYIKDTGLDKSNYDKEME